MGNCVSAQENGLSPLFASPKFVSGFESRDTADEDTEADSFETNFDGQPSIVTEETLKAESRDTSEREPFVAEEDVSAELINHPEDDEDFVVVEGCALFKPRNSKKRSFSFWPMLLTLCFGFALYKVLSLEAFGKHDAVLSPSRRIRHFILDRSGGNFSQLSRQDHNEKTETLETVSGSLSDLSVLNHTEKTAQFDGLIEGERGGGMKALPGDPDHRDLGKGKNHMGPIEDQNLIHETDLVKSSTSSVNNELSPDSEVVNSQNVANELSQQSNKPTAAQNDKRKVVGLLPSSSLQSGVGYEDSSTDGISEMILNLLKQNEDILNRIVSRLPDDGVSLLEPTVLFDSSRWSILQRNCLAS